MWDETTPRTPAPSDAPGHDDYRARGASGHCPLCGQPTGGALICVPCSDNIWDRLRAGMGEEWYARHAAYRPSQGGRE